MAAGLTVRRDRVEELRRQLSRYYRAHPAQELPALEADVLVSDPALLDMENVESLDRLEPCGNANPRPLLYMEGVNMESIVPIGGGRHLRLKVSKFGQTFDCVFFSRKREELGVWEGQAADLMFVPQINEFRSQRNVQLVITDLRPHERER